MGNSHLESVAPSGVAIRKFYTPAAWIEGRAEDQLDDVARLPGVSAIAAFPDLHPGKYGPVGCAVLSQNVHPQLAGSDIGCGMSLFALDLAPRRIKPEKAAARLRALGQPDETDRGPELEAEGLPGDLFHKALGTIGGGNHFCELQIAEAGEIDTGVAYLLVHSGSRGLGHAILTRQLSQGLVHYPPGDAGTYLSDHDKAVTWARLNRLIVAKRAAAALRADVTLVVDAPHNLITKHPDGWLHRKGAAVAAGLVPLAGTRATPSFLVEASDTHKALDSLAHGAGRRYDRRSMHGRVSATKSSIEALRRPATGGRVICDDKGMLIEEAPKAYKSAEQVLADLETLGLARKVARFRPVVTFKHAQEKS